MWPQSVLMRNIPTRVGKTRICWQNSAGKPEHPHARGENTCSGVIWQMLTGTSPRAWGKLNVHLLNGLNGRNIPTRVGKTERNEHERTTNAEHPHARGENPSFRRLTAALSGTSPRAWGKRDPVNSDCRGDRNIPTRVGKTAPGMGGSALVPEHPHARGENAHGWRRG